MKCVVFRIKRHEKRDPLNVIPVIVRHQNVRFQASPRRRHTPARAERPQSRSAIQNELRSVRRNEFQTRRVSTIPPRRRIHRRRGAAHTPKTQFADRNRHFPEQCPWNESLPAPTWRVLGSSFDTRSGCKYRQSLRKSVVSNCLTIRPSSACHPSCPRSLLLYLSSRAKQPRFFLHA